MSAPIKNGGPAFPFGQISEVTGQPVNGFYDPGMTLRDYFAAKAMPVLLAEDLARFIEKQFGKDWVADQAYAMADAMLRAREATK